MNAFEKQLLINGKSLAELPDLFGCYRPDAYGPLVAPQKVSGEDFLNDMAAIRNRRREVEEGK
jgi:hypothetical protein